jgi:serine O-acetyltransferase
VSSPAGRVRRAPFVEAVLDDARVSAAFRNDPHHFTRRRQVAVEAVRLAMVSDAFLAQVLYRLEVALRGRGVPVLPAIAHRLSLVLAQLDIGPEVVMAPGTYFAHGQVSISGPVDIERLVVFFPWSTVAGGPERLTIRAGARIGTGSVIEGVRSIGREARVGANAVVVDDVPDRAVVTGVPGVVHERVA